MIGYLRGRVIRATPEAVLLDVAGVGYALRVSLVTFSELERRARGDEVELYVHTHAREDELALYGFASERERELFEKLIAVSGIGPRLAQVILSGMPADDLVGALARGDVPRLVRIPGVGKKTAERMVVELRDKVAALASAVPAEDAAAGTSDDDLVAALVHLGYKPGPAQAAVAEARRGTRDAPFPALLRDALRRLSRV